MNIRAAKVRALHAIHLLGPIVCSLALARLAGAADFDQGLREASAKVMELQPQLEQMATEGRIREGNEQLLAVFPPAKRSAVQALVLGNVVYGMDAKLSYALHQEAARKEPHEPRVLLEWAMEQHRAGEMAGALAAYDEYAERDPEFAPAHGLAADCLIRLNRVAEAKARWRRSEEARRGSLETFESLVCEIYKDASLHQKRAELLAKTQSGDVDAAVRLIALDGKFERDWWNNGPHRPYLEHDLPLLQKLPGGPRLKAAQCAGECLLLEDPPSREIRAKLERYGFLIDANRTLPADGTLLGLILSVAMDAKVVSRGQLRGQVTDKVLAAAAQNKDAELFNVVAYLQSGTTEMLKLEQQAWEATGDVRFAAGYLMERLAQKSLSADDPLLKKALRQFPEDSWILSAAIAIDPNPSQELLVQGIKAEYRHFSAGSGLFLRPSARTLRTYFARLNVK